MCSLCSLTSVQKKISKLFGLKKMKILKKIRERISSSPKREECYSSLNKSLMPVCFNKQIHGENVKFSADGLFAKRTQSFCKAIVFSNRALLIGEEISIVVTSVSSAWSGSLRVGFCNVNPNNFKNNLPKYMCPDLTNVHGCFARALLDEETMIGNVLTFWLNQSGQIMYRINQQKPKVFLQITENRHLNIPMWAMIDVYGLVTSIKIVNTQNFVFQNKALTSRSCANLNNLNTSLADLNLSDSIPQMNQFATLQHHSTKIELPVSRYYANVEFNRMQLSETVGANVKLNSSRTIASRKSLTCDRGYVFTKRPLNLNEKLVIQILKDDQLYNNNIGFGLTTCNPINLNSSDLPSNSHELLNRNEYWLVIKDVLVNAKAGDELGFTINSSNQVELTKNNLPPVVLMHVDSTQRFYAFFDLHGKTTKIQVLGTYYPQSTRVQKNLSHLNGPSSVNNKNEHTAQSIKLNNPQIKTIDITTKQSDQESTTGECTVCFEKSINCVLYQCGHMCMCYDCAIKQWTGIGGGQCPICRAMICDVIRTYAV